MPSQVTSSSNMGETIVEPYFFFRVFLTSENGITRLTSLVFPYPALASETMQLCECSTRTAQVTRWIVCEIR